ncbi:hypothetical protein MKY85_19945 [Paenibacillus sp. FSL R5-0749]|uniref:hypothetical protein n=1 Tax=Paenibacillus sp. FSL R5-0749 TaxID=2921657 RepID=UPI00315A1BBF
MINEEFFNTYIRQIEDINLFSEIFEIGSDASYKVRNELVHNNSQRDTSQLMKTMDLAHFIEIQEKKGFPFLYNLLSIRIWSLLEAFVDEFIIKILIEKEDLRSISQLGRLKGELINFLYKPKYEQADLLLDLLKADQKINGQFGVGKFESLLNIFDHGGHINNLVSKQLMELSQIRNILVHKNGLSDERVITNCPWLDLELGQEINLDLGHFQRYMNSVYWYVLEVFKRQSLNSERTNLRAPIEQRQEEAINLITYYLKFKSIRKKRNG